MELRLNDDEIRNALAEAMEDKVRHTITNIEPEECWFEVKAGVINGEDVDDIHEVTFCYKAST